VAVRRNNGAPGIDATTLAEVEEYGVDRLLDELAEDLRSGRWRPSPARRVFIPKPGTTEQRPLSIPTVGDRIVGAAQRTSTCMADAVTSTNRPITQLGEWLLVANARRSRTHGPRPASW